MAEKEDDSDDSGDDFIPTRCAVLVMAVILWKVEDDSAGSSDCVVLNVCLEVVVMVKPHVPIVGGSVLLSRT